MRVATRSLNFRQINPKFRLETIVAASIIGCLGNEGVALFRIKVGKEIGSAVHQVHGMHLAP